jgi:hypothetical protein
MKTVIPACLALLFIAGCKKDNIEVQPAKVTDYFPMTIGSYWVYDNLYKSENEDSTRFGSTDSTWIAKDTLLGAQSYRIFAKSNNSSVSYTFYRDSADCIIDQYGSIVLSMDRNGAVILEHELNQLSLKEKQYMQQKDSTIIIPSGQFTTRVFVREMSTTDNTWAAPEKLLYFYAKNTGLAYQSEFFFSNPKERLLRRLNHYYIAP